VIISTEPAYKGHVELMRITATTQTSERGGLAKSLKQVCLRSSNANIFFGGLAGHTNHPMFMNIARRAVELDKRCVVWYATNTWRMAATLFLRCEEAKHQRTGELRNLKTSDCSIFSAVRLQAY
jgi:hypothetical protein